MANFKEGFKPPEMTKTRPVVVLSPPMQGRGELVTVVALSSVRPDPIMPYHLQLPQASLPLLGMFQTREIWMKGDLLGRGWMREIYGCVLEGLKLGHLAKNL